MKAERAQIMLKAAIANKYTAMVSIHMKTAMVSLQAVMFRFQVKAILAIIKVEMAMPKLLTTLQQHADKIMEINQTTIILVRILIMSMGGQRQTNKEIPTLFISGCEEPKHRLPIFTGKGDWKSFFLQFELLADRYNWSMDRKREEIIFCLKDEALSFVTQLSVEVRTE